MKELWVEVYNNKTYQRKYDIAELFKHLKDMTESGRLVVSMNNSSPGMVELDKVVGTITNVTKTVESIYADINILPNPMGNVFKTLTEYEFQLKYSVQAIGTYKEDNKLPTIDNVICISVDRNTSKDDA